MVAAHVRLGLVALLAVVFMVAPEQNGDAVEVPDVGVDVEVAVGQDVVPGVLALSIAPGAATLHEEGSTAHYREFHGVMPTVWVHDTRFPGQVPADRVWTISGAATSLRHTKDENSVISGACLGWAPHQVGEVAAGQGLTLGPIVEPQCQEPQGPGLGQAQVLATGVPMVGMEWLHVGADLTLRTPKFVPAGSYQGKLTLSLFE